MPFKNKDSVRIAQYRHRCRNRVKFVEYLKAHPCVDCGEEDIRVLDFDHRDPSEKYKNVTSMGISGHFGWKTIMLEIDKCDIRCANCHRKRTIGEPDWFTDIEKFKSSISCRLMDKAKVS